MEFLWWWCFCGGVFVEFVWWCLCGGVWWCVACFCGGGVFVVLFLWRCFLWWCFCAGVFMVVWWCFCGGVFVVVFFVVVFL